MHLVNKINNDYPIGLTLFQSKFAIINQLSSVNHLHICPRHLKSVIKYHCHRLSHNVANQSFSLHPSETSNQSPADKSPYQLNSFQHQITDILHASGYTIHLTNQNKAPDKPQLFPLCVPSQSRIPRKLSANQERSN